MNKSLINNPEVEWDGLVVWSLQNSSGKDISDVIYRLVWGAAIYKICCQRNARIFGGKILSGA